MPTNPEWRPVEFDGLVIESANGDRLLALPVAVLEILRYASVIRFRRAGAFYSMRLDTFADASQGGHLLPAQPASSVEHAPTPSPTPPPAAEGDPLDPANVPMRVWRGGAWTTVYVTRDQYERYTQQGRTQGPTEGDQQ